MKRLFFLLAALTWGLGQAAAQDTIVKTDSKSILVKILEISPSEVRYKRFSNPDGPTFVLPVADIAHIVYQNGERDDFNPLKAAESATESAVQAVEKKPAEPVKQAVEEKKQAVEETPAVPAVQAVEEKKPAVRKPAAVQKLQPGDIYTVDGVTGMVLTLDESGEHGLMMSLQESLAPRFLPWTLLREPMAEGVAADKNDGAKNMLDIERYIAANGLSWDDFPAFKWCRELGEGWYLPAVDELLQTGFVFNGNQRMKFDRKARQTFNNRLKDNGGVKLDPMANYYSSTYGGNGMAVTATMEVEPPYVESCKAVEKYLVRAVRRF